MPEQTLDRAVPPAPAEAAQVELVPAPTSDSLLHDLERARDEARRWRGRFLASCLAFGCLLVVSVIQFGGAFVTCQLLHETRVETDKALQEGRTFMRSVQQMNEAVQHANRSAAGAANRSVETDKSTGDLRFAYEELRLAYREQELILGRLLEWQRKIDAERPRPREALPLPRTEQE